MKVLMLSPEPPYPLHGGGAYRTASLLGYFARFADVDLILISESGHPALIPSGLVQSQRVIALPRHSKSVAARYFRNARRAFAGIPPLIDRLSGLESKILRATEGRHYDLGIVEHFWCAPYVEQLSKVCDYTVLDLHNIESVLHERCATFSHGLLKAGHRRFAAASRALESALLPRFSLVLATSEVDARTAHAIAPAAPVGIYPNSFPWTELPSQTEQSMIVFSGNFEYHPNIDAVEFLVREIWPELRRRRPGLRLRLVGRGDASIRHLLPSPLERNGIEVSGPVEDALAEIARARIVVAPLRAGSGTRIKILEAWAACRPVVATPLAAEGLEVKNGGNIALADPRNGGAEFVAAIETLLDDDLLRQSLGAAGRRTFEARYCWNAAWAALELYPQLTRRFGLNRYTGNF